MSIRFDIFFEKSMILFFVSFDIYLDFTLIYDDFVGKAWVCWFLSKSFCCHIQAILQRSKAMDGKIEQIIEILKNSKPDFVDFILRFIISLDKKMGAN